MLWFMSGSYEFYTGVHCNWELSIYLIKVFVNIVKVCWAVSLRILFSTCIKLYKKLNMCTLLGLLFSIFYFMQKSPEKHFILH